MSTPTTLPEQQTQGNQTPKEVTDISSMLLPIEGRILLLPGVAVAEIVSFVSPEPDDMEAPVWFLGSVYWRNQRVPLVSFEAMVEGRNPFVSSHCRIAILNNTGLHHQLSFFALLLQATPKLLRLTSEALVANNEKIIEEGEILHVKVDGEEAIIPDISFMERKIIEYWQLS